MWPDCHGAAHSCIGLLSLWAKILRMAEKRLTLDGNKTLGNGGVKWVTGRAARDCSRELAFT
jgi:hypothetical protein